MFRSSSPNLRSSDRVLVLFLAGARLHANRVELPVAHVGQIELRRDPGNAAVHVDVDRARPRQEQIGGHAPAEIRFRLGGLHVQADVVRDLPRTAQAEMLEVGLLLEQTILGPELRVEQRAVGQRVVAVDLEIARRDIAEAGRRPRFAAWCFSPAGCWCSDRNSRPAWRRSHRG